MEQSQEKTKQQPPAEDKNKGNGQKGYPMAKDAFKSPSPEDMGGAKDEQEKGTKTDVGGFDAAQGEDEGKSDSRDNEK